MPTPETMGHIGSPAAGWYADPSGEHLARYWDGATWTDQVRDDVADPAPSTGPGAAQSDLMARTVVGVAEAVAVVAAAQAARSEPEEPGLPARSAFDAVAPVGPAPSGAPEPGWYADPAQRHAGRWWDGSMWTDRVVVDGVERVDAILPAADHATAVTEPDPALTAEQQWTDADDALGDASPALASSPAPPPVEDTDADVARDVARPSVKVRVGGGLVLAGAVGVLAGSSSTWMRVRGPRLNDAWTATGLDLGDGRITIVLAVLLAVLGAGLLTARLARVGGSKVGAMGALVAAAAGLAVTAVDIADVADRASRLGVPSGAVSNVGNGLWLAFVGSLFAAGGGLLAFTNRQ